MSDKKIIIIAGMHRSGTSLMACICHHLGVALGDGLIPAPVEDNKIGYWEPQKVVDLHEKAFAAMKMRSDDCYLLRNPPVELIKNDIKQWLDQFGGEELIAVKDPRICRFIGQWVDVAQENNYQPVFIIPLRNPLEVVQSLAKRGDEYRDVTQFLIWWLVHVLEAERASRGYLRVTYSYTELLNNWRNVASKVANELAINWSIGYDNADGELSQIIDNDLYRNRKSVGELAQMDVLGWASEVFTIMTSQEIDCSKLDEIYCEVAKFLQPLSKYDLQPHGSDAEIKAWKMAVDSYCPAL